MDTCVKVSGATQATKKHEVSFMCFIYAEPLSVRIYISIFIYKSGWLIFFPLYGAI